MKEISKRSSSSSPNYAKFIPDRYLFIHSFIISNDEVSMTSSGNSCASLTVKKYFFPLISNLNYSCCNLKLLVLVLSAMDMVNWLFLLCTKLSCLWILLSSIDQSLSVIFIKLVTPKSFSSFSEVMFLLVLQQTVPTVVYILLETQSTKQERVPQLKP